MSLNSLILQIETVGPEGKDLLWIVLIIALIALIAFLLIGKIKPVISAFSPSVSVKVKKNKIYHPSVIHISLINNSSKNIEVKNPVIRFKRGRKNKAYKIKTINSNKVYPFVLDANKTHQIPVALQPFYDYNRRLKKYSRLRIEFQINASTKKVSKYILLKPTLFRKEKK